MTFCWMSNPKFKGQMLLGLHSPIDGFPASSNRQQRKNPLFRHGCPIFLNSSYFDQRTLRCTLISFPLATLSSYILLSWFFLLLCFCFLRPEEDRILICAPNNRSSQNLVFVAFRKEKKKESSNNCSR